MLKWLTTEGDPVAIEQPYQLPDYYDEGEPKTTFWFKTLTQTEQARIQAAAFRVREVNEMGGKKVSDDDVVEAMNEAQVDQFAALCMRINHPNVVDARKIRGVFRAMPTGQYQHLLGAVAAGNVASDIEGKGSGPQSSPALSTSTPRTSPSTESTPTTARPASGNDGTGAACATETEETAAYVATGD